MSESPKDDVTATDKPPTSPPPLMPVPTGHSLPASALAEVVRNDIERAGFPELNETVMAAEAARGVASIRAGTALPVDAGESKGDAHFLDDLADAKSRMQLIRAKLADADENVATLSRRRAELTLPITRGQWWAVVLALFALTGLGVATLKELLTSSFDELLFRSYFHGLPVADPEAASHAHAERLVICAAAFMLGGKALSVVGSSGRLSLLGQALLVGIALMFSGAFAIIRLSAAGGFGFAAIAVSLIELALLTSFSVALLALGSVLRGSADRGAALRTAEGAFTAEATHAERLRAELTAATSDYEGRRRALAQREDDCRRLPLYEDVARTTVEVETLVATAALITATVTAATSETNAPTPVIAGGTP